LPGPTVFRASIRGHEAPSRLRSAAWRVLASLRDRPFISGRPKEKRLALLKALNDQIVAAAGISSDDLLITLYETPGENISFGRGLAQRAHISEPAAVS
jgi:Tautomerase enzyme